MNTPLTYFKEDIDVIDDQDLCQCAYCRQDKIVEAGTFYKDWNDEDYDFVCGECRSLPEFIERKKANEREIEEILSMEDIED